MTTISNLRNFRRERNRSKLHIPYDVTIYFITTPEIEEGLNFASQYQGFNNPTNFGLEVIDLILRSNQASLDELITPKLIQDASSYFKSSRTKYIGKTQVTTPTYLSSILRERLIAPSEATCLANYLVLSNFSAFLQGDEESFLFEDTTNVRRREMRRELSQTNFNLLERIKHPISYEFPSSRLINL